MSTSYPAPLEAGQPSENMVTVTHLVYALTWFGMALLVVVAAGVMARYEVRLRTSRSKDPAHEQ